MHDDEPLPESLAALEAAWALIANAGGGDWETQTPEWRAAAERWRDEHWHPALAAARA